MLPLKCLTQCTEVRATPSAGVFYHTHPPSEALMSSNSSPSDCLSSHHGWLGSHLKKKHTHTFSVSAEDTFTSFMTNIKSNILLLSSSLKSLQVCVSKCTAKCIVGLDCQINSDLSYVHKGSQVMKVKKVK